MAHLVRFEPDPSAGGDLGLAHFDDGSSLYTSASMLPPELLGPDLRLAQAAPMQSIAPPGVPNVASSSAQTPAGSSMGAGYSGAPMPENMAPAPVNLAGTGGSGGAPASPDFGGVPAPAPGEQPAEMGNAPVPLSPLDQQVQNALNSPIVTRTPPQPKEQQLPNLGTLSDVPQQAAGGPSRDDQLLQIILANQRAGGGPGLTPQQMLQLGAYVPSSQVTTSEQGTPYSPAEAQVRELANQKVVEAHIATAEAQATRAQAQQLAAQAALPALQKQAAENQAHFDTIKANYDRERAQLQAEIDDFDRSARVDPHRWFAERGAWGQIGAIIAQALGAYAATISGSPNWAQEAINREIDRDIDAQKATISVKRAGQQNALSRLADRYGDVQQAEAALKLSQQQIADKQILSFAAGTQKDDIINAAREWVAQNAQQRAQEELNLYHASIGKQTVQETQKFTLPQQGTGNGPRSLHQLAQQLKDTHEILRLLNKGQPPEIKPPNPANPLYVAGLGYAHKTTEAEEMRKVKADYLTGMEALDAMEVVLNDPSRLLGTGRTGTSAYNRADAMNAIWRTQVAKAFGGVITGSDLEQATLQMPDITSSNITGGETERLKVTREKLERAFKNKVLTTMTPYEPEAPLRAKSEED